MGKRIVVADNDPEWRDLIALDLTLEGHRIVGEAGSGEEALALCAAAPPDVLVVDHRMPPGMDGAIVAARVRDLLPQVPVIIFSNQEDPAVLAAAVRAGARLVLKTNLRALRQAVLEV